MSKAKIIDISEGKSLFEFVDSYWKEGAVGNNIAFHRLCNLMRKMNVQRVIAEEYEENFIDNDIDDELKDLRRVLKKVLSYDIYRFTFVSTNILSLDDLNKINNGNVLSSAVLINIRVPIKEGKRYSKENGWISYLFKAYVKAPTKDIVVEIDARDAKDSKYKKDAEILLNNYLHVCRKHKIEVSLSKNESREFTIYGTYFCQQNSITSVCAHVCTCMMVNNMKQKRKYLTSYIINKLLNNSNWVGKGLKIEQINSVLNKLGLLTKCFNYFKNPELSFNELIYSYLESQFPSLLIFITKSDESHVVSVIGHTLNTDLWKGEARRTYSHLSDFPNKYCVSSEWVDHFIINDDNYGMFLCLPIDLLKKITLPQYDPYFRAYRSITIVPYNDIKISPAVAESSSVWVLLKLFEYLIPYKNILGSWMTRFIDEYIRRKRPFLSRTLLVDKKNYVEHLKMATDSMSNKYTSEEVDKLVNKLPNHFYLTEISLPDIYTTNKSKLIDIVYACDYKVESSDIFKGCLLVRMPMISFFNLAFLKSIKRKPKVIASSIQSYIKLFTFERSQNISEW